MIIDYESGNFEGAGEKSALQILESLTGLSKINRNLFFITNEEGLFKQIPITWILGPDDLIDLSDEHKKGSIDIFIKTKTKKIAVRIQGKGHGERFKGAGKAQHDRVQKRMLEQYCKVVDVTIQNCPSLFKERVNETSIQEVKNEFITARVEIPFTNIVQ